MAHTCIRMPSAKNAWRVAGRARIRAIAKSGSENEVSRWNEIKDELRKIGLLSCDVLPTQRVGADP